MLEADKEGMVIPQGIVLLPLSSPFQVTFSHESSITPCEVRQSSRRIPGVVASPCLQRGSSETMISKDDMMLTMYDINYITMQVCHSSK